MIRIGLTGSIAMGKSASAEMFRQFGVPVHDADATVHQLMKPGGAAFSKIAEIFPNCIKEGQIDRKILGNQVFKNPADLTRLENILHPLVRQEERKFIRKCYQKRQKICVLDIPLLFETKGEKRVHQVCVVSASKLIQRKRALARSGMNEEKLNAILNKQMSDFQKRKRADHIIFTGNGYRSARNQVKKIIRGIKRKEQAFHA